MSIKKFIYTKYPKQYGKFLYFIALIFLPFKLLMLKMGFKVYFGNKEQDEWVVEEIFNEKNRLKVSTTGSNGGDDENGKNGGNNTTSIDEKLFNWTPEALERIEKVPSGFMRDNTKSRVLGYAESINVKDITLEVIARFIATLSNNK